MTDREMDILACKNVLGYTLYHYTKGPHYYAIMNRDWSPVYPSRSYDWRACEKPTEAEAWELCSTGAELAALLEDEIERRGLQEQYIQALDKLVTYERREGWEWFRWGILRATPAQRRDAALKATGNL